MRRLGQPGPARMLVLASIVLVGAGAFGAVTQRPPLEAKARQVARLSRDKPERATGRSSSSSAAAHPATSVTLVWTGEQNGHLEPCGCSKPQLGGMVRRGGFLQSLPAGPSLRLDNGDLTEARGRQDELKAETSIQLLNELGYAAINLGEAEFRLGLPYLQSLASSFKGALLCANARDAADRPVFHEYLLKELRLESRTLPVAVVGLISEQYAPEAEALNPGLKIASAGDTLDRLRPALEGQPFVILMFHGPPEEARQLVAGQQWISAVIVAHAPDDQARLISKPGETPMVTVGRDGKFVGVAQLVPAPAVGGRGRLEKVQGVALGPETPESSAAREIEAIYLQRVTDEKLLEKVPRVPIPGADHFAGSATCRSCHPEAHRIWAASRHAHAWAELVHVGHQRDPDCVGCHVVGLEFRGGFQDAAHSPQLENVGCESCHQAAGRHAASPATVRPPKIDDSTCATCHTSEQSPGFEFHRYWAMIKH